MESEEYKNYNSIKKYKKYKRWQKSPKCYFPCQEYQETGYCDGCRDKILYDKVSH